LEEETGLGSLVRPKLKQLDGYVYPVKIVNGDRVPDKGKIIFPERPEFKLEDCTMAFREDGKRTVNRFFEKIDGEITRALDVRLWSMAFWVGVAKAIDESRNS
jgi:hypothetical protein